jgi:hypothetical protein
MNTTRRVMTTVGLLIVSGTVAMQALAGTVRGGSPYGIGESIRDCQIDSESYGCEGFRLAPIQVNGRLYNGADFFFRSPRDANGNYNEGLLDIIDVGPVKAGGHFFLPLRNPNLSFPNSDAFSTDTLATGVFVCKLNDPSNPVIASSSTGPLLGLPCTGGTDNAAKVTATIQSGGVMFSFQGDLANLVLFTEEGNVIRESDGSDQ